MIREIKREAMNGYEMLVCILVVAALVTLGFIFGVRANSGFLVTVSVIVGIAVLVCTGGFLLVNPNEGVVLQLFGAYCGTVSTPGLQWANPFYTKRKVSLRVRNFETQRLKVNEQEGNPIEIATIVVWKVVDTAEAVFCVDDYENYVHIQSESALRNLASRYQYDAHSEGEISLRSHTTEIVERLMVEVQDRLGRAGVEVLEARISHLAYAPEIAGAMLQRQQASAIIAARQKIVEGAVGMVEMALDMLSQRKVVELDEKKKAEMVSNLLVVLCSMHGTQPMISVGTASE
ncbi:MAG: SPFH domain-containing protein [Armatimonadetes bacterium]|nr:SPFH domain-containing protein [Armatimonadota bacterium]